MPRLLLGVAMFATLSAPAWALDCKNPMDQTSLNQCADQTFRAADAELNTVYAKVVERLPTDAVPNAKSLLVSAQRGWVTFRDAECAFRSSVSQGGSMHPMVVLACETQLTRKRIADLNAYLSCKAEDDDCPTSPAN